MSGASLVLLLDVLGWGLLVATAVVLVPAVTLLAEVVAAALVRTPLVSDGSADDASIPPIAVLMPAHDEARGIVPTLRAARAQLRSQDRLLVVADNCSDDTASVARAAGAEVIERVDALRRGKGHALDFGVRHLAASPPAVVVVLDADCLAHQRALMTLARAALAHRRPAQALYRMALPSSAGERSTLRQRLATFAWELRNHVRPLGAAARRAPCALFGTGMAFPWAVIRAAPLASGHLVEDLELGVALAAAGTPARFCPQAEVRSSFPADTGAATTQRTRWEQGHLALLVGTAPRHLARALLSADFALAALMLDLLVPPLALLVLVLAAFVAIDAAWWFGTGDARPIAVAIAAFASVALSVVVAWARYGRHLVSFADLLRVPFYVAGKLPLYARMLVRRQAEWIRTKRDEPHG